LFAVPWSYNPTDALAFNSNTTCRRVAPTKRPTRPHGHGRLDDRKPELPGTGTIAKGSFYDQNISSSRIASFVGRGSSRRSDAMAWRRYSKSSPIQVTTCRRAAVTSQFGPEAEAEVGSPCHQVLLPSGLAPRAKKADLTDRRSAIQERPKKSPPTTISDCLRNKVMANPQGEKKCRAIVESS
jgi:hypothetical protein